MISKNARIAILAASGAAMMVGMAYAAVPFYRWFCQVTGFGGTTQIASVQDVEVLERTIRVRFSATTNRDIPWNFKPKQQVITLRIGEQGLAFYEAENLAKVPVAGQASFNVTPFEAGPYFSKIECFCFTEQTLQPGERVDMPVAFYVDPAIADDKDLDDVSEITLNYTFFMLDRKQGDTLAAAVKP